MWPDGKIIFRYLVIYNNNNLPNAITITIYAQVGSKFLQNTE